MFLEPTVIFAFVVISKTFALKYFQQSNLDYYDIQEETTTLSSNLQCCIYCSQFDCCEGVIQVGNTCQLLQNVKLSSSNQQTLAWIDSSIVSRGTILDKILMITGEPFDQSMTGELIDFKDQKSCLTNLTFPKPLKAAYYGQISKQDFIICGGDDENLDKRSECYHLDLLKYDNFQPMTSTLKTARSQGSSVSIKDVGLWIIGGTTKIDGQSEKLSSTEIIVSLDQVIQGPELPKIWTAMCAVNIEDKNSVFIGGGNFDGIMKVKTTYFYQYDNLDFLNGNWRSGPDFLEKKFRTTCALLKLDNGKSYIVAGGGMGDVGYDPTNKVEILDLDTNIWTQGNIENFFWANFNSFKLQDLSYQKY